MEKMTPTQARERAEERVEECQRSRRSYELFARHVIPRVNGTNARRRDSMDWARDHRTEFMGAVGNALNQEVHKHLADVKRRESGDEPAKAS